MALVFRLEDAEGKGVYSFYPEGSYYGGSAARLAGSYFDSDVVSRKGHPTPQEDKLLRNSDLDNTIYSSESWLHGFTSIEQLRKWFDHAGVRLLLQRFGIIASVYEVPDESYRAGEAQALFRKADAKLVDTLYAY